MENIKTDIGKIYCRYVKENDDFYMMRLLRVEEEEGKKHYIFRELDKDYRMSKTPDLYYDEEGFKLIKENYTFLRSEGIATITSVVAIANEAKEIRDVVAIYFPNNKETKVPDVNQPMVVARQSLNNVFDVSGKTVGMSVSIETVPSGFALTDFMENDEVISSTISHVYKTDTALDLAMLLSSEDNANVLYDLYDHEIMFLKNTVNGFAEKYESNPDDYLCVYGYNKDLCGFLDNSGFMNDVYSIMKISKVDFEMESNKVIDEEDKLLLAAIYGVKINKAVPLKFGYDIDLSSIRMRYFMVKDVNDNLFIVPYTVFADEFDASSLYNLTEERTLQLQSRLIKCVNAYEAKSEETK